MLSSLTTSTPNTHLRFATEDDCDLITEFIIELARYEHLKDEVIAESSSIRTTLFGDRKYAEVIIAEYNHLPVGFALFFHNYSTFLAKPGIYLEDLFVKPHFRRHGIGQALLSCLAKIAVERNCGRLEWSVLNWNELAINFYKKLKAKSMDEWTTYQIYGDEIAHLAQLE